MRFLFLCMLSLNAHALSVHNLGIEYRRTIIDGAVRMMELPNQSGPFERVALDLNLDLWGPFYYDHRIHMIGTRSKVDWVGYRFELGVHPIRSLDLFYQHHSQHALDHRHPSMPGFPVEDFFGFRWNILGEGRTR